MGRRETALKYFEENKEYMQARINYGIETYRKGDALFKVCDKDGNPIKGVKIIAKQKNHEFKYGANIFMLDELESEEKNNEYRKSFKEVFNLATIPFYWSDLEPEQGKPRFEKDSPKIYRRPATDLCVEYCLENNVEPKCHCLNYDNFTPQWVRDADVKTQKKYLEKRFRELAERYGAVIPSWEVTNETLNWYTEPEDGVHYGGFSKKQTKFYRENDFVDWSFKTADRYFPNNELIINDYRVWDDLDYRENRSAYYMQIERLINSGAHLDTIGMQFHSFFKPEEEERMAALRYNPIHLYEVLDKYAELGKKIQITEMTISAFSNSREDEDIQNELVKNLYSIFFSHPAMNAIIYWNMVDGYAAFAPQGDMTVGENMYHGGLMRFDMSKKPAFHTIKRLFEEEWHTEAQIETDENGMAKIRGFYGDYNLILVKDGKEIEHTIKLSECKMNNNIIVFE